MLTVLSLAFATLLSEDLTCVAAGALVAEGRLSPLVAIAACAAGIVAGDFGLWIVGRTGIRLTRVIRASPSLPRLAEMSAWLRRHSGGAIVASRFLPGTRLPLYVTAGAIGIPATTFVLWSAVAATLWTPAIVLLAAGLGKGTMSLESGGPLPALVHLLVCLGAIPLIGLTRAVMARSSRARIAAKLARWRRWEFWPMWLFYGPVAVWIACLSIRHRGLTTLTASNPAIPEGGVVGESKFDILSRLPADSVIPAVRVPPDVVADRLATLRASVEAAGWSFPLVLKPDVGQRGAGVKRIESWDAAAKYLSRIGGAVLAQPYHEGPFEAGVFYYRFPDWPRGRILSITDKVFPEVVGDGVSTLGDLIWRHPRFRMQAHTFLARHEDAATRVVPCAQRVQLALAGNHAQGTLFRDGAHLITAALEARIDQIAQHQPGFFIGRFDIRYHNVDEFKAGRDLAIVELNGATAESTNIYDPDRSLWSAYRTLFHQWSLVFAIGAANRRRGVEGCSFERLVELVRLHLSAPVAYHVSD